MQACQQDGITPGSLESDRNRDDTDSDDPARRQYTARRALSEISARADLIMANYDKMHLVIEQLRADLPRERWLFMDFYDDGKEEARALMTVFRAMLRFEADHCDAMDGLTITEKRSYFAMFEREDAPNASAMS